MKTASDMKEQRHMAAQPEPIVNQSGGSDRMQLVCHWEFLKRLVRSGRLAV